MFTRKKAKQQDWKIIKQEDVKALVAAHRDNYSVVIYPTNPIFVHLYTILIIQADNNKEIRRNGTDSLEEALSFGEEMLKSVILFDQKSQISG